MADLGAIIAAIVGAVQTASPALRVIDFYSDSLAIGVGGLVEVGPASDDGATNAEHHQTSGGRLTYSLTVTLYLPITAEEPAQRRMYAFMSTGNDVSIADAINTEQAVFGVYQKLHVERSHSYLRRVRSNGELYLTNSWEIKAVASE